MSVAADVERLQLSVLAALVYESSLARCSLGSEVCSIVEVGEAT